MRLVFLREKVPFMLVKMAVAFIIMCLGTMKRVDEEGKG